MGVNGKMLVFNSTVKMHGRLVYGGLGLFVSRLLKIDPSRQCW